MSTFEFERSDQRSFARLGYEFTFSPQFKSIESSCRLSIKIWKTTAQQLQQLNSANEREQKMNPYMNLSFGNVFGEVATFQNCTHVLYSRTLSHFTHSNRNVYHKLIFNCIKNVPCVCVFGYDVKN